MPQYPEVVVRIPQGCESDVIILACLQAIKESGTGAILHKFTKDVSKNTSDDLIQVIERWFTVVSI